MLPAATSAGASAPHTGSCASESLMVGNHFCASEPWPWQGWEASWRGVRLGPVPDVSMHQGMDASHGKGQTSPSSPTRGGPRLRDQGWRYLTLQVSGREAGAARLWCPCLWLCSLPRVLTSTPNPGHQYQLLQTLFISVTEHLLLASGTPHHSPGLPATQRLSASSDNPLSLFLCSHHPTSSRHGSPAGGTVLCPQSGCGKRCFDSHCF